MRSTWFQTALWIAICGAVARGESLAERPDLSAAQPVATCKLQSFGDKSADAYARQPAALYMIQPLPEDPLANYERTPLGDWRMPASVDRRDPWMRLVLLGPKRPLVVDLAVFVDGQPFRESREAWIDDLLTPQKPAESPEAAGDEKDADGNKADESDGTKSADAASEGENADAAGGDEEESEQRGTKAEEAAKAEPRGVPAQARKAPTMRERLMNYLTTSESAVDREEIRWLIAEWGSGPDVLLLGPSLSWQRAGLAPLVAYLDSNEDGALSSDEIAEVNDKLKHADMDANDVVDANELRRAADRPAATPFATGHSLLVPLDAETDWDSLAATADRLYPESQFAAAADGDGLRQLADRPADVTLRVDFGATEKDTSGVSVIAIDPELGDAGKIVSSSPDVVTLDLGADYVEFSAAQPKTGGKEDVSGTQVAVGAAIDGHPLMRLVDRDNDHRLTMRERQELAGLLATLDRDGDGALAASEMPMPIRFAVTLGPQVHELLATPVGAARTIAPRESAPAAPAWFVSMDKNGDHDLSRGEFLGTTEQFRQFDADGDGLLGVAEVLKGSPGQ